MSFFLPYLMNKIWNIQTPLCSMWKTKQIKCVEINSRIVIILVQGILSIQVSNLDSGELWKSKGAQDPIYKIVEFRRIFEFLSILRKLDVGYFCKKNPVVWHMFDVEKSRESHPCL